MDDSCCVLLRGYGPKVIAAESDGRDVLSRATKGAERYLGSRGWSIRGRRAGVWGTLRSGGWHDESLRNQVCPMPCKARASGSRLDWTLASGWLSSRLNRRGMKGTKNMKGRSKAFNAARSKAFVKGKVKGYQQRIERIRTDRTERESISSLERTPLLIGWRAGTIRSDPLASVQSVFLRSSSCPSFPSCPSCSGLSEILPGPEL